MKSSVYISTGKIQVIGYSGNAVKRFVTVPLQEGTVINGMITDPAFLIECLTALRAKNPELFTEPSLVVDGSTILTKRIAAPKLNKRQYYQLVRDDFAESGENELVCDYQVLDGEKAIFACAASSSQIDSYIETFKNAGIKLKSIRFGAQAILNYIASRQDLRKATFVLNVVDGLTMVSMIFDSGVNVFMSRTRLYGETPEQMAQNILENLNGLLQFNRSQQFSDITVSYYMGIDENDLRLMDAFSPYHDINLRLFNLFERVKGAGELPPDAHFAYLSSQLGNDSIDLMESRKKLIQYKKRQRPKKTWIPLLLVYILLLASPIAYLYYQTSEVNGEISSLRAYMESPEVMVQREHLAAIESETSAYNEVINQRNERKNRETGTPLISDSVVDLIVTAYIEKVTVTQFDYNENTAVLRVGAAGDTDADASEYVERLKKSELIQSVKYKGYSYGGSGEYNFFIDVTLTPENALSEESK